MKIAHSTRTLITSTIAIIACVAILIGSTFAWFTDSSVSGVNQIQSGNLGVELTYTNSYTGTPETVDENTKIFMDINGDPMLWEPGASTSGRFEVANDGTLALKYQLQIIQANATETPDGKTLADALSIYAIARNKNTGTDDVMEDAGLEAQGIDAAIAAYDPMNMPSFKDGFIVEGMLLPGESFTYEIGVCWIPTENDNDFNVEGGLSIDFAVALLATQVSYETDGDGFYYDTGAEYPELPDIAVDTWDGTVDFASFMDEVIENDSEEVAVKTAEQFMAVAKMLDKAVTNEDVESIAALVPATFAADADEVVTTAADMYNNFFYQEDKPKTIVLESDIDLLVLNEEGEPICFDPIGSYRFEQAFTGVFDGQGHTIYNLNQNTWELNNGYYYNDCGLGLFGAIENATIKNLTIDGANISGESAICGTIAAYAGGTCVFENITIKNANVADYQYYAGGLVGWASGNHTYTNCVIDASTTVATQWGDFDNATGGLIGGASSSAEILVKDSTIACRIDATSDVVSAYQWFAYRRAGMIIGMSNASVTDENGRTEAACPQLTCENVTVIYGDWANYTYCEFAGTGYPYVRVQEGISVSAYSNVRYGHPTDANGNTVVDDNHVHNDGEDHQILIEFDQLYGGGQGVYGAKTHDGVTIVYNNK